MSVFLAKCRQIYREIIIVFFFVSRVDKFVSICKLTILSHLINDNMHTNYFTPPFNIWISNGAEMMQNNPARIDTLGHRHL